MSSDDTNEALISTIQILTNPNENEAFTITDIQDNRMLVYLTAMKTMAEIFHDDVLGKFVYNFAIILRSRKRKGSKEIVEMLRGARARVLQTTVLSGVKRIMVGQSGVEGE